MGQSVYKKKSAKKKKKEKCLDGQYAFFIIKHTFLFANKNKTQQSSSSSLENKVFIFILSEFS